MTDLDNPAGRLKSWIERFSAMDNKDQSISQAISELMRVDHESSAGRAEYLRVAGKIAGLLTEVREEAQHLPDHVDADIMLAGLEQFDTVVHHLTQLRQTRLTDMLGALNSSPAMQSLGLLDRQLSRYRAQSEMAGPAQRGLLQNVRDLLQQVREETSLDDDLKDFIIRRFVQVEAVLADVEFDGAEPVEVATEALLGSFTRSPGMWQRIAESSVADVIGGIIVGLLLSLSTPPPQEALPPATPTYIVDNYTVVIEQDLPADGVPPEVIEGFIAPGGAGPPGLPPGPPE